MESEFYVDGMESELYADGMESEFYTDTMESHISGELPGVGSLVPLLTLSPDAAAGANPAQSPEHSPDDSWHPAARRCVWCGSGTCGGQRAVGKGQRQGPAATHHHGISLGGLAGIWQCTERCRSPCHLVGI